MKTETVTLADVERLHVGPGDVLVYKFPGRLTRQQADDIKAKIRAFFDADVPVMVMDQGAKFQVISQDGVVSQST
jgi:hypothetical protein